jgi:hypothetical protein
VYHPPFIQFETRRWQLTDRYLRREGGAPVRRRAKRRRTAGAYG